MHSLWRNSSELKEREARIANSARVSTTEAEARREARREAAPAALVALLVLVGLAAASWAGEC